jgi:plastocyanin
MHGLWAMGCSMHGIADRNALRAIAAAGLTFGLAAGALGACFSKREATAPVEGVCSFPLGEGVPGSTMVVISDFAFGPGDVRVRAGERVTWINCDVDQHTSTADAGQWTSPLLAPGDAFTQTFPTPGEFSYFCEPHPFMTGRVIVE